MWPLTPADAARRSLTIATVGVLGALAAGCSPDPAPSTSPTPDSNGSGVFVTASIDNCLVGTWRETHHEILADYSRAGGGVAVISGAGRTLTFEADGTEIVDYGTGSTLRGTSNTGAVIESAFTGRVEFDVTTANGTLSFATVKDEVTVTFRMNGGVLGTSSFGSPDPVSYTCAGDRHTQSSEQSRYRAEYERVRP